MNRLLIRYGLIFLLFCLCGLALVGCGSEAASSETMPSGLFIDSSAEQWMRDRFEEVQICTGIEEGEYNDLSIILMPPLFPCPHYTDGCSGEYVRPNSFKIGALSLWRHEVIHFLLDKKTGDEDRNHKNSLFWQCG